MPKHVMAHPCNLGMIVSHDKRASSNKYAMCELAQYSIPRRINLHWLFCGSNNREDCANSEAEMCDLTSRIGVLIDRHNRVCLSKKATARVDLVDGTEDKRNQMQLNEHASPSRYLHYTRARETIASNFRAT
jgi:hypothetical protein